MHFYLDLLTLIGYFTHFKIRNTYKFAYKLSSLVCHEYVTHQTCYPRFLISSDGNLYSALWFGKKKKQKKTNNNTQAQGRREAKADNYIRFKV